MKTGILSLAAVIALGSASWAGGVIPPVVEPEPMVEEAVSPFYVGIALADLSTRGSSADLNFFGDELGQGRALGLTLLAGYEFNPYIAVEGRYTTAFGREDVAEMSAWSIFAKPQYPVSEDFSIYALLGFGGVTIDGITLADNISVDDTGFQWGLGMSYSLKGATGYDVALFLDYTSLASDMDGFFLNDLEANADALSLGATFRF
jgi:opacity protein-like surface antigen